MSYANADSSKNEKKSITLGGLYSIAIEFDKEVTIIPNKNKPYLFSEEKGLSEIKAFDNAINKDEKTGKTIRINNKTGRPYTTRTISKRLDTKKLNTTRPEKNKLKVDKDI